MFNQKELFRRQLSKFACTRPDVLFLMTLFPFPWVTLHICVCPQPGVSWENVLSLCKDGCGGRWVDQDPEVENGEFVPELAGSGMFFVFFNSNSNCCRTSTLHSSLFLLCNINPLPYYWKILHFFKFSCWLNIRDVKFGSKFESLNRFRSYESFESVSP